MKACIKCEVFTQALKVRTIGYVLGLGKKASSNKGYLLDNYGVIVLIESLQILMLS